jgi:hypothetical protein
VTNGTPPAGPLRRGLQTGRLEALSDGVYAIAITLLVLDIVVPADAAFIRLNLLLLLVVAFLPFPTRLFADYIKQAGPERVAATIYGISLLLSATLLWVLWRYAVRAGLVRPDAADEEVQLLTQRLTPRPGRLPDPDRRRALRPGDRRHRVPGHRDVLHHPVPPLAPFLPRVCASPGGQAHEDRGIGGPGHRGQPRARPGVRAGTGQPGRRQGVRGRA